jgi:hemolysin activation/secretion protein
VLGQTPIGRSLDLVNLEWRVRLVRWQALQLGAVAFYDGGRVHGTVGAPGESFLHALGVGVRAGVMGLVVRVDYAASLSQPSSRALTAGLGQVF